MEDRPLLLPSRLREGSGVGTFAGIRRPTDRAQQLRRDATPAERVLWRYLRGGQLGCRFNRQMPVGPYICDFLCRSHRLAVELDGESHTATGEQDRRRTAFINALGIRVLRFANADVMRNAEGVIATIRGTLAETPNPDPSREREGS